jgi:hypothetical protein
MFRVIALAIVVGLSSIAFVDAQTNTPTAVVSNNINPSVIATLSGSTYERCKILRDEPDGLVIMYSGGIKKIPYDDLPETLRRNYVVKLPWYIDAAVAAQYWPNSIQEVLRKIAPEIALAHAQHEQALRELTLEKPEPQPEHDMAYWYNRVGAKYAFSGGELLSAGEDVFWVRGKILSVVDNSTILVIDANLFIAACHLPSTENLFEGQAINVLGRPIGTYRYTSVAGAVKQVKCFEYTPSISLEDFTQLGKEAFPEIKVAEVAEAQAHQRQISRTHERLVDAERSALQRLNDAGRSTYDRLLAEKVREEKLRAEAAGRDAVWKAQRDEQQKTQEESARRERAAEQAERASRAAAERREKFRFKSSKDFQ